MNDHDDPTNDYPLSFQEMLLIPRGDRLWTIFEAFEEGVLTPARLNTLLVDWWVSIEFPMKLLGKQRLVRMFRFAGFVTDTEGITAPTEPLTVYRGADIAARYGLAWTTNEAIAAWFARRHSWMFPQSRQRLYTVTIAPRHVLGILQGRNEAEVIVNPLGLRGKLDRDSGIPVSDERVQELAEQEWR
jgi:hypothetical protein